MAPRRETPSPPPPPSLCPEHSGIHQRIRDLEGRATAASEERRDIVKEVTGLRVSIARWMGGLAVLVVVVQVATAILLKVLS